MKNSNLYRLVPSGQIEDEVVQCTTNGLDSSSDHRDDGNLQMRVRSTAGSDTLMVDPDTGSIIPIVEFDKKDDDNDDDATVPSSRSEPTSSELNLRSSFTVFLLFFINLINYIDRYTTAGVLADIIKFYNITDSEAGLMQTVFIIAYMLLAPVFGYLGDRYNRIYILVVGIAFWSGMTLLGSFVPSDYFWAFLLFRGLVGVGEASYTTVAPTIIADLFSNQLRTNMLTIFYFAIPVGSGLGYIVGSQVKIAMDEWQWALRVTPTLGLISVSLLLFCVREPQRGESDGGRHLHASSSWLLDVKSLIRIKTYMLSTLGLTAVSFVAGAIGHWTPHLAKMAKETRNEDGENVNFIFGGITCASGIVGVVSGAMWAKKWKERGNQRADALVCSIGLLICSPFMLAAIVIAEHSVVLVWVLIAIAETCLCMNWAVVADILFYIVIPTRRSTAEAFQILVSHLFGDAGSPTLIGVISDSFQKNQTDTSVRAKFVALQSSLYSTVVVCVLGGIFFIACSSYIVQDKKRAEELTKLNELRVMEAIEENIQLQSLDGETSVQRECLLPSKGLLNPRILQLRNESQATTTSIISSTSNAIET